MTTRTSCPSVVAARRSGAVLAAVLALPGSVAGQAETCQFRGAPDAVDERPSPLDSVTIDLGGGQAKLCYGRPSARGRTIVGGQDPFGAPWRFGANEPTTLHLPFDAAIGDVEVGPGSYSLYAIPDRTRWTIVVNSSTNRWGIPISAEVRAADVGAFTVPATTLDRHVETLEFDFVRRDESSGDIVYRWEHTQLRVPIARR